MGAPLALQQRVVLAHQALLRSEDQRPGHLSGGVLVGAPASVQHGDIACGKRFGVERAVAGAGEMHQFQVWQLVDEIGQKRCSVTHQDDDRRRRECVDERLSAQCFAIHAHLRFSVDGGPVRVIARDTFVVVEDDDDGFDIHVKN